MTKIAAATSNAMPTRKMPIPPNSRARRWTGAAGDATASGLIAAGMSGSSTAMPQWTQNFQVGARGAPHPAQVFMDTDCIGVA